MKLLLNVNVIFCMRHTLHHLKTNNWDLPVGLYPSALWAGGVLSSRAGQRAGLRVVGCHTCGTHLSVTAWLIFSVQSSVELSRPVVVHCHGYLSICPIWACPWAKKISNLPQIGSRLCGMHISEIAGWIYPISSFMDLFGPVVQCLKLMVTQLPLAIKLDQWNLTLAK